MKRILSFTVLAIALITTQPALSHGGEDHGAPPPPVNQAVDPRATATTEEFEVVTALEGKQLVVYVDQFASNEPVTQAKVEVEGKVLKGMARETTPGTYVLDVTTPPPPAKHPLTISIETIDGFDLLTVTLDTSAPVVTEAQAAGESKGPIWGASGALLLIAGALVAVRRHTRNKEGM